LSNRTPLIRVTAMPADTNPYGGVFGGWLMGQMGLAAGSLASRRSKGKAVVVAADELRFTGAMKVGDELSIYGELKEQGTSSMTIAVEAVARHRNSDDEFPVATGTFKFVALDESGKPRPLAAEEEKNG
jgi:acyl-CoA thioesterase YciA